MDHVQPPNFLQSRHKKLQSEISEMSSSEMKDQVCDFGNLLQIQKQGTSTMSEATRQSTQQTRDTIKSTAFSFGFINSPPTFGKSILKENHNVSNFAQSDFRPTVFQQGVVFPQQPLPSHLLKKKSNWSDSSDSNEKIPKSLAVRGKFVFDPEHGGGRRRRDKHLPRQKNFTENDDKIGYVRWYL